MRSPWRETVADGCVDGERPAGDPLAGAGRDW